MRYDKNDIMDFGKHQGFKVFEIYKYNPSYIEWAIEYCQEFEIDPGQFDNSVTPFSRITPVTMKIKNRSLTLPGFDSKASVIPDAKKYIADGNTISEIPFSFSEKSLEILKQKKNRTYKAPEYVSRDEDDTL